MFWNFESGSWILNLDFDVGLDLLCWLCFRIWGFAYGILILDFGFWFWILNLVWNLDVALCLNVRLV